VCAASLAGNEAVTEIAEVVAPFGNDIAGVVIDLPIAATCAWAVQQEFVTRDANRQKIFEEVQRRVGGRRPGPARAQDGPNRFERRAGKREKGRSGEKDRGFAPRPTEAAPPAPLPAPPPAPPLAAPPEARPEAEAAPSGMAALWQEANALGRAQALVLNGELEQRGVLQPLAAAEVDGAAPEVEGQPAVAPSVATAGGEEMAPAASTRKTGKKGARKKSRKQR